MTRAPAILGIETSCDETAAAVVAWDAAAGVPRATSSAWFGPDKAAT